MLEKRTAGPHFRRWWQAPANAAETENLSSGGRCEPKKWVLRRRRYRWASFAAVCFLEPLWIRSKPLTLSRLFGNAVRVKSPAKVIHLQLMQVRTAGGLSGKAFENQSQSEGWYAHITITRRRNTV